MATGPTNFETAYADLAREVRAADAALASAGHYPKGAAGLVPLAGRITALALERDRATARLAELGEHDRPSPRLGFPKR